MTDNQRPTDGYDHPLLDEDEDELLEWFGDYWFPALSGCAIMVIVMWTTARHLPFPFVLFGRVSFPLTLLLAFRLRRLWHASRARFAPGLQPSEPVEED